MLRPITRIFLTVGKQPCRFLCASREANDDETKPWLNPWDHAVPKTSSTTTSFEEIMIDWSYVERLMPYDVVPPLPKHDSYPTPSGWQPPQDPPPKLPYYVRRKRDHTLPLYLSRRRDLLNEKTLDFDYVELVTMKEIDGDVFACERDLREFLEKELCKPIATHVDELKGRIVIKGADRAIIEKFLFTKGF